jgi:hypothetical protein
MEEYRPAAIFSATVVPVEILANSAEWRRSLDLSNIRSVSSYRLIVVGIGYQENSRQENSRGKGVGWIWLKRASTLFEPNSLANPLY